MGSVLAELLVARGCSVTYLTPSTKVSEWSFNTLEQGIIQARLLELDVDVRVTRALMSVESQSVRAACTYTGKTAEITCDAVVLVTARLPNDPALSRSQSARSGVGGPWHHIRQGDR